MSVQPNGGGIRLDAPGAVYATRADSNSSLERQLVSGGSTRAHGPRVEKDHALPPANAFHLRRSLTGRQSGLSYPPPLPAQSIIGAERNPFMFDNRTKERAALTFVTGFFAILFLIPIVLIGVMLRFQ